MESTKETINFPLNCLQSGACGIEVHQSASLEGREEKACSNSRLGGGHWCGIPNLRRHGNVLDLRLDRPSPHPPRRPGNRERGSRARPWPPDSKQSVGRPLGKEGPSLAVVEQQIFNIIWALARWTQGACAVWSGHLAGAATGEVACCFQALDAISREALPHGAPPRCEACRLTLPFLFFFSKPPSWEDETTFLMTNANL